jgi:hypothetical protein
MICRYCGQAYADGTSGSRLFKHISHCARVPPEVRASVLKAPPSSSESDISDEPPPAKRGRIDAVYPRVAVVPKSDLDMLWTKAMIHGGVAFRFSDNPFLHDFIERLSGGYYQPPCGKTLATTALDGAYETELASLKEVLKKASGLTLLTDGW